MAQLAQVDCLQGVHGHNITSRHTICSSINLLDLHSDDKKEIVS